MCAVSNIGDDYTRKFPDRWPNVNPWVFPQLPDLTPYHPPHNFGVSQSDFNKLKAEVEELKKLLLAAKEYDKATNQTDCEQEEKVALLKQIAKLVNVNLDEVFK